jgi:acyl-CoA synthetase (AMP-forming)/AMP-acid ligase II
MGTMEIESALVSCTELVAEAAVVGRPDDTTGEAVCAFVVLKRPLPAGDEAKAIAKQLRDHVGKEIGPIAKPKTSALARTCPRHVRARSCAACCAPSPKAKPLPRIHPPWKIHRFWISWAKPTDSAPTEKKPAIAGFFLPA